ncbi:MAG: C40 family peptidase [Sulfurovum sp.]|nr:C40 family peptidase [Sulfurovum sp.]
MDLRFVSFVIVTLLFLSSCSQRYDYTIHKPKVKYQKPSPYALQSMLKESLGKPYRWAEEGKSSFDCSGLIYYSYGSMNLWLPRRSIEQSRVGKTVAVKDLVYGDLIFFDTKKHSRGNVNHVGIYVGNHYFRHASSKGGKVMTSSLKNHFYRSRIVVCKRVMGTKKVRVKKPTREKRMLPKRTTYPKQAIIEYNIEPLDTIHLF